MEKTLNSISTYSIILLPILLITGPFLSDLSIFLVDIIFLTILFKNKEKDLKKNFLFNVLVVFNVYISLVSLFAEDIHMSLKSSLFYIRFGIYIFALNYFLKKNTKIIDYFFFILSLVFICLTIDAVFQFILGYNVLGFQIDNVDKINSFFNDEAVLGSYLIKLLPLYLSIFIYKYHEKKTIFTLIIFTIGFIIFLSGSRSSIFLFDLFFLLLIIFLKEYRKYLLIPTSLIIIFFTIIFSNLNFKNITKQDFENNRIVYKIYYNLVDPIQTIFFEKGLSDKDKKGKKMTVFTQIHQSHYNTAYNIFLDNKFFGIGNKMFRIVCKDQKYKTNKHGCSTHPHNYYIQVLSENGLIGFSFVLILFIYINYILIREFYFRFLKRKLFLNNTILILLFGIYLNVWPFIPTGNLYNNWNSILIYFPIGFYLFFQKMNNKKK